MSPVIKIFLPFVFVFSMFTAMGQTPKRPMQKFKPPKLTTMWGIRGDSAIVLKEEIVQLVKLPLRITDDKKAAYTISSYQFLYKRRVVTEDETTGKAIPTYSTEIDLFRATPLTPQWQNIVIDHLKPGEELFFFDVVVKDAAGRLMYAPTLRIFTK